ncbi:MAG: hypothetical protein HOP12_14025 [Candidatus Eisenbacteria bacterium]|uniref:DUF222 domain-containing protein n=1 Tax=Eiseniibacteriota bacterium TaxID=2212470 RepID=A0A849SQP3_UNCEI|nr:hypothetical protein [Candidatus Eisenbacteria bacterium]
MPSYSLSHLADRVLLRDLASLVSQDRNTTASLLAHLAEVEARGLYRPAAYPSMFAYCVGELHLSEFAALRRIRAARTARDYPVLFEAIADGRLNLTAVLLLTPHLTPDTVDELVRVAKHRTKPELEQLSHSVSRSRTCRLACRRSTRRDSITRQSKSANSFRNELNWR